MQYTDTSIYSLTEHKFEHPSQGYSTMATLPHQADRPTRHLTEVNVDKFMSLVVSYLKSHLCHIAHAAMMGIHDEFPAEVNMKNSPILLKKL